MERDDARRRPRPFGVCPGPTPLSLFRSAPGVSDDHLLAASTAVQDWLCQRPGFRRRLLAKSSEGEWLDLVVWSSLAYAERAATAIESCPGIGELM